MDGPPVMLKAQAMEQVENFSTPSTDLEAARERARSRLNELSAYYQDPTRIDDQHAFIRDAAALRALTDFDGTDQSTRLDQIVELVATADNRSARQVIRDAEYAFTATEADLGPGMTNSVEAHIDNARRQLDRAERIRDRASKKSGAQSIRTTAQAIRTYGSALKQARTALRLIDRKVGSDVTLTRRTDPIHNGSEPVAYTLVGNVTNPTGLDATNVTATINDDRTVALPLRGDYTNATFAKPINLTERVNTIEILAVEREAGQKSKNSSDGGSLTHSKVSQASTVVLRLDGDGLPDTYEGNVTGTDPLDPDSDAPSTAVNEATNGTIDSHEDFDGDRLITARERKLGTDPLDADTDDDGLDDGVEPTEPFATDPLDPDFDDDGLADGQELRGITKATQETTGGKVSFTNFNVREANILEEPTDPLNSDTDGDGYWDGWIGVHDVGYSDNVILYREHLQSGNGISGDDERVDEQVGVHIVHPEDPGANLDNAPGSSVKRHSNVHIGELHWDSDPTDPNPDQLDEKTSLEIEVDWIEGRNPDDRTIGGQPILDAIKDNYALYGINLSFHRDQSLSTDQVTNVCKLWGETWAYKTCMKRITLPGLNAFELHKLENKYHNDTSKMHMLFATNYSRESEIPIVSTHDPFIDPGVDGLEGHTGSPGQAGIIETAPYGTVILADEPELDSNETMTSTTMHELGHALSIGWLDDKGPGHIAECYSGGSCYGEFGVGGGDDETPEEVDRQPGQPGGISDDWSVMSSTAEPERMDRRRFAFSLEELFTVDFSDIPSKNE
ncbi:hypothetical protein [Halorhabdus sp. BNX81]|uniref:hypothetical protein n=1 Tax=Halorhabdus sp. BNX81 TaxID=2980181 RepID=UPI0023DD0048|nr:hypothetical protein [Halorhabdus sp. BNX81]WEL22833.1 Conserved hypothetical protein containing von Willebrand factor type A [Halorhabdus sp. BNX81]